MTEFDVVVVGGGPGGYVAAIRGAQLGMKVACIEKGTGLGGTCLHEGCIPSKTLLYASEMLAFMKGRAKDFGLGFSSLNFNWEVLQQKRAGVIEKFQKGISLLFNKHKVKHIVGTAQFEDAHTLLIENEGTKEKIRAKNIILATGSKPIALPFLPFDEKACLSSTGALSLSKPPKKMVVVGWGVIGLELGSVYQRVGTEVSVVEALPMICPGLDVSLSKALLGSLENQGMQFFLSSKVKAAKRGKWTTSLEIETKEGKQQSLVADVVLVAIGRKPNTTSLNLADVNISLTEKGFVQVNQNLQTSHKHIYAIGDLVDGPMLAHKASEEGVAVMESLAGLRPHVSYTTIPSVVYTHPEVASVGLTEEEAKKHGLQVKKGKFLFAANSRASCCGEEEGFVQVLAEKNTDRIVGVHIIGGHASELIAAAGLAIELKATAKQVGALCHAHPTLSEAFKEACLAVHREAIHG